MRVKFVQIFFLFFLKTTPHSGENRWKMLIEFVELKMKEFWWWWWWCWWCGWQWGIQILHFGISFFVSACLGIALIIRHPSHLPIKKEIKHSPWINGWVRILYYRKYILYKHTYREVVSFLWKHFCFNLKIDGCFNELNLFFYFGPLYSKYTNIVCFMLICMLSLFHFAFIIYLQFNCFVLCSLHRSIFPFLMRHFFLLHFMEKLEHWAQV